MDEKKVKEAIEALKIINLKRVHPFYDWEEMREVRDIAIEALEKQLPMKVKIEAWCPSCCPSCGYELSEDLGDGYYKHPDFIERCPNPECAQRLEWSKLK